MDRDEFAKGVDALLQDKTLALRLGLKGRELADERFNFDTYINSLENLFSRAVEHTVGAHAEFMDKKL